ncbi:hypothetical protein QJS10_CPA09g01068 [Acorus calamus]|uniref:Uncharacterized protein n=1 Tax=Acorus calamus TaxID=4465 RepID=A0AAV9E613_ACOCL|nr:hypothetical protein QJS10_CPA09g01068 [Acorus calamus]
MLEQYIKNVIGTLKNKFEFERTGDVENLYFVKVVERNASFDAEIGRLWKFDGYRDSLGEVGVGGFIIQSHKNMFIVPD